MPTLCVTRARVSAARFLAMLIGACCHHATASEPNRHVEATLAVRPAPIPGTRLRVRGELSQRAPPVIESGNLRISARLTSAALNGACVSDVIFRDNFGS